MLSEKTQAALLAGDDLLGHFGPAGVSPTTPGLLRWSADHGAHLDLVEPTDEWPNDMGSAQFTVHGLTSNGDDITLLDTWIRYQTADNRTTGVSSSTLVLGGHIDPHTSWTQASYSTANLTEWVREHGRAVSYPGPPAFDNLHLDWQPPAARVVDLQHSKLTFGIWMSNDGSTYAADWSMRTRQLMGVTLETACSLSDLHRQFAQPLLAFTHFVSDRPDSLTHETLHEPKADRYVAVLRQGPVVTPREWRPTDGYLFHADGLRDFSESMNRWWTLHDEVWPALGVFASHVTDGNTYSPARLLLLYSALEAYSKVRHGHKDFRKLRQYAGIQGAVIGATNTALDLLGASRGYFSHLKAPSKTYSLADVENALLPSTRRGSGLMQACLLRELGFEPSEIETMLARHYKGWAI
jgi:hypothetical protein